MVEILQLQYKTSNYYGSQEKKKNENNPKPQFVQTSKKKNPRFIQQLSISKW